MAINFLGLRIEIGPYAKTRLMVRSAITLGIMSLSIIEKNQSIWKYLLVVYCGIICKKLFGMNALITLGLSFVTSI